MVFWCLGWYTACSVTGPDPPRPQCLICNWVQPRADPHGCTDPRPNIVQGLVQHREEGGAVASILFPSGTLLAGEEALNEYLRVKTVTFEY